MKIKLLLALFLATSISSFSQTELTDIEAESKLLNNNDRLILVDFYATWCGPCKRMAPIIKELEAEYPNVDFYKIDVDKNKVDDALGVSAMPTYLFIKNSSNLEQIEGAMSKEKMKSLLDKHLGGSYSSNVAYDATKNHGNYDEFSDMVINEIKNSSSNLNSLAWHAYLKHDDIASLLKAIKIVEKSIALGATYYNVDTHAALLYKTGRYTEALKKAKEAISIAKSDGVTYDSTTELIDKIIDKM